MTSGNDMLLIGGPIARNILRSRQREVVEVIRSAYSAYGRTECTLPHSTFLRLGREAGNRIIGLPAYLGGGFDVAGIKWVASFPENVQRGLDRASATLTLNDCRTGKVIAFMEASSINAHRTAASAALAARHLSRTDSPSRCALVGCGYIGFEVVSYLLGTFETIDEVSLLDKERSRAEHLCSRLKLEKGCLAVDIVSDMKDLSARKFDFLVFATSASVPWLDRRAMLGEPGTVVLHVSLRDIEPAVLLECSNVVDDADHACRERTSVHLAEQGCGNRRFIDAELPDLVVGRSSFSAPLDRVTVFSPFGLGVLDLALGKWVLDQARAMGVGEVVREFFPDAWHPDAEGVLSHE